MHVLSGGLLAPDYATRHCATKAPPSEMRHQSTSSEVTWVERFCSCKPWHRSDAADSGRGGRGAEAGSLSDRQEACGGSAREVQEMAKTQGHVTKQALSPALRGGAAVIEGEGYMPGGCDRPLAVTVSWTINSSVLGWGKDRRTQFGLEGKG